MKRKLFGFGGALVILLALMVLAGCDNGNTDPDPDPDGGGGSGKKTITIENNSDVDILGVAVYDYRGEKFILGDGISGIATSYDTSKTAVAGATMTAFDITLTKDVNYYAVITVELPSGKTLSRMGSILDEGTPTAYTFKLETVWNVDNQINLYELQEE